MPVILLFSIRVPLPNTTEMLRDLPRGGAIPGSVHIEWLNNLDENGMFRSAAELRALYESAGITPEKRVMSY